MRAGRPQRNTVQITFRIDKDVLKKIEQYAEDECIDRMGWLRRAIAGAVFEFEDRMTEEAAKDYIHLRIDETEFLDVSGMKRVPKDIEERRKEMLKLVMEKKGR